MTKESCQTDGSPCDCDRCGSDMWNAEMDKAEGDKIAAAKEKERLEDEDETIVCPSASDLAWEECKRLDRLWSYYNRMAETTSKEIRKSIAEYKRLCKKEAKALKPLMRG